MNTTKISIVASAFVLLIVGCGGGGGESIAQNPEETKFDNFGNGVKGQLVFKNEVPGSPSRTYEIMSIKANQCRSADISPIKFTIDSPDKNSIDKPAEYPVNFDLQFLKEGSTSEVELANKCMTDRLFVKYNYVMSAGLRIEDELEIVNPNYKQDSVTRKDGDDPLYQYQWHLKNTGQSIGSATPAKKGNDINVEDIWKNGKGITGRGIVVAVIDEGIDIFHPDLKDNINVELSHNYHTGGHNTTPFRGSLHDETGEGGYYDFSHGTSVAGLIAAKGWNGIGTRGVAPNAKLVSYNSLEIFANEAKEFFENKKIPSISSNNELQLRRLLDALQRHPDKIDIYNNSWGSSGKGTFGYKQADVDDIDNQFDQALKYGIVQGRDTKGSIYVKAAGNDSASSQYDRMQTNGYSVIVAASDSEGIASSYTNYGPNILVNAPGGSTQFDGVKPDEKMIVTTDLSGKERGYDADIKHQADASHFDVAGNENYDYTQRINGTSAATPIVSGVIALMLEAKPELTWRDVQYILATTAFKNDSAKNNNKNTKYSHWSKNAAGYYFNKYYGFGRVDAKKAVEKAKDFTSMGGYYDMKLAKEDIGSGTSTNNKISKTINIKDNISKVEYVTINLGLDTNDVETTYSTKSINGSKNKEEKLKLYKGENIFTFLNEEVDTSFSAKLGLDSKTAIKENAKELISNIKHNVATKKVENIEADGDYILYIDSNSTKWSVSIETPLPKGSAANFTIELTSPSGTKSILLEPSIMFIEENATLEDIRLSSVQFLDEKGKGNWKLDITNIGNFNLNNSDIEIRGR